MVHAAKASIEALPNVSVVLADSQDLSEFADERIDAVTCCYGYMFPPDKARALLETHRVLKPGGLLVTTTWDHTDILKVSRDVMTAVLGQDPSPPPMNPLSLNEKGLFKNMVIDAGFQGVDQTVSTYPFSLGADKAFQFKSCTLLIKDKIDEVGEEGWKKAEEAFWANIGKYTERLENGELVIPENTFRLTVAKK